MSLEIDFGDGVRFWEQVNITSNEFEFSSANYDHNFKCILEHDVKEFHYKWKNQMTKKGMTCGTYFTCEYTDSYLDERIYGRGMSMNFTTHLD